MSKQKTLAVFNGLKLTKHNFGCGIVNYFLGPVIVGYTELSCKELILHTNGAVQNFTVTSSADAIEKITKWLNTGKLPQ